MHPVLFSIGSFGLHSYGLMLAISFVVAVWYAGKRAESRDLSPAVVSDVAFWIIISAIIGARLYYVILHFEEFSGHITDTFNPFQNGTIGLGGLVMYGGLIGAILAGLAYFRLTRLSFLKYADVIAPTFGIGIMFTRVGCFLNGCCYGMPTNSSIGVNFPIISPAGQYQAHMHAHALFPSQLFLSFGGLFLAVVVIWAGKKIKFDGFEFYLAGAIYSVIRFLVDFTRFYGADERLFGLSHNQVICIVLFAIFSGLILKNFIFPPEEEKLTPSKADS